jgi:hypothetical protein
MYKSSVTQGAINDNNYSLIYLVHTKKIAETHNITVTIGNTF